MTDKERLEKALRLACEMVMGTSGKCPVSKFLTKSHATCFNDICEAPRILECWVQYFLGKASKCDDR
jgi:hypothetical protein